jgi:hypothetical protein
MKYKKSFGARFYYRDELRILQSAMHYHQKILARIYERLQYINERIEENERRKTRDIPSQSDIELEEKVRQWIHESDSRDKASAIRVRKPWEDLGGYEQQCISDDADNDSLRIRQQKGVRFPY